MVHSKKTLFIRYAVYGMVYKHKCTKDRSKNQPVTPWISFSHHQLLNHSLSFPSKIYGIPKDLVQLLLMMLVA